MMSSSDLYLSTSIHTHDGEDEKILATSTLTVSSPRTVTTAQDSVNQKYPSNLMKPTLINTTDLCFTPKLPSAISRWWRVFEICTAFSKALIMANVVLLGCGPLSSETAAKAGFLGECLCGQELRLAMGSHFETKYRRFLILSSFPFIILKICYV